MIFLFFFLKKNNSALGDPITPALEVERKIKSFILGEKKKISDPVVFFYSFLGARRPPFPANAT